MADDDDAPPPAESFQYRLGPEFEPLSLYRRGSEYTTDELREKARRELALMLALLVFSLALLIVIFLATNMLSGSEAKDLAAARPRRRLAGERVFAPRTRGVGVMRTRLRPRLQPARDLAEGQKGSGPEGSPGHLVSDYLGGAYAGEGV
jgi:hypothetical protein